MGYHGALSHGCQRCRTRKVKCDETKPKCLTCEKANLICTGYRDLNAIVFRDESPRIVRRIEKKAAKKARLAAAASRRSSVSSPQGSSSSSSSSSNSEGFPNIHPPLESIDTVEVKFFVYNYAFHEVWRSEAYERWVFDSIKGKDDLSQGLRAAIGAAGCAGLSNVRMAPGAAKRSRMLYGKALGIVNAALRGELKVVPDALLLTVVILGLHEIISFNVSRDNRAWQSHINGAAALLELRGVTQFKNERGVQLYFQIRNQILTTCIQHSLAVPESLLRLDETFSASYMHRVLLKSHKITPISVFNLWAECIDILHLLKNAQPGVVQRAITLDNQLSKWTATLPEEWYFKILAAPDAPFKLEHEYSSTWIAYVWNNWRLLRTVTNLLIAEGGVDRDERRMRIGLILQYSKDICIASRFSNAECALAHFRPLFGVATAFHSTPQLREFAAKQLQLIAQISGIQQAKTTADEILALIDRKKRPDEGDMLTDEWVTPF